MAFNCSRHHRTLDHSAVTTLFKIKRSYDTSSAYNYWLEYTLHGNCSIEKQGKHHCRSLPRPSLALLLPPTGWLFTWQWDRIRLRQISRTSSIIWNSIQTDHCQNPQANGILERTHQVIGNLLRSSHLIAQDLDNVSAQQELLMPVMWAINTTFHMTLKASPPQLAFSRDMILPTSFATNWYAINNCKQT
jgi:hypothetical protein